MRARAAARSESVTLKVHIPLAIRKRGGRKRIIAPKPTEVEQSVKQTEGHPLLTAITRAYRWQRKIENGTYPSLGELAAAEGVDRSCAGKVMRLMLLAPDLIQIILDGTEPDAMNLDRLLAPFPCEWRLQRSELSSAA